MKNGMRHGLEKSMDWASAGIDGRRMAWGNGFQRIVEIRSHHFGAPHA